MELYKIIATIVNTSTTFQLAYLPENFEGIKINQKFSFVNPIGFNPKFSVDTMRIILTDKTAIDSAFDTYGLQARVVFAISKLNASGIGYTSIGTSFEIDFESYEKFDEYSEFALKSISAMDYYNTIKNSEIQIDLSQGEEIELPTTQYLINYISLKKKAHTKLLTYPSFVFQFESNNESKIYDKDIALGILYIDDYIEGAKVLSFGQTESVFLNFSFSGNIEIDINFGNTTTFEISIYKGGDFSNKILTLFSDTVVYDTLTDNRKFDIPVELVQMASTLFNDGDDLFIAVTFASISEINNLVSDLFFDIKKQTNLKFISGENKIKAINADDLLEIIFNGGSMSSIPNIKITSANSLSGIEDKLTIKPSDLIRDICIANGLVMDFKSDGKAYFTLISLYFQKLLSDDNAISILDYKDLSVGYFTDMNFSSVSAGTEIKEYDIYTYLIDWNKILTFNQENRNASENLDLSLTKFRTDFSGILDYFYKRTSQKTGTHKDTFIFKNLENRTSVVPDVSMYDYFTPRDILTNWSYFLASCFQNFNLNTLKLSSNGGNSDNIEISTVKQFDDIVLNETPRLLPIKYEFTCLIDNLDFSESILKINHNGEDVYLFVFNAETTDRFSEQKISGLKIQF